LEGSRRSLRRGGSNNDLATDDTVLEDFWAFPSVWFCAFPELQNGQRRKRFASEFDFWFPAAMAMGSPESDGARAQKKSWNQNWMKEWNAAFYVLDLSLSVLRREMRMQCCCLCSNNDFCENVFHPVPGSVLFNAHAPSHLL
jgi:hypothetical protein